MQKIAPHGAVYVCGACGKRSRDLYGYQAISPGWDESCSLNAFLCDEESLVMDGQVVRQAEPWNIVSMESSPGDNTDLSDRPHYLTLGRKPGQRDARARAESRDD